MCDLLCMLFIKCENVPLVFSKVVACANSSIIHWECCEHTVKPAAFTLPRWLWKRADELVGAYKLFVFMNFKINWKNIIFCNMLVPVVDETDVVLFCRNHKHMHTHSSPRTKDNKEPERWTGWLCLFLLLAWTWHPEVIAATQAPSIHSAIQFLVLQARWNNCHNLIC